MGAMKELFTTLQQEFAEYKYIKDGCPEGDARNETWESMVKSFFDGDNTAALEEFQVWCGGKLPDRSPDVIDDRPRMSTAESLGIDDDDGDGDFIHNGDLS